jgi:Protein of unknown function (DUF2568)
MYHWAMNIANSVLAFGLEIWLLVAVGLAAWRFHIFAFIAALAVVLAVWSRWLAPKAAHRLRQPQRALLKLLLFVVGAVCLWAVGHHATALIFLGLALVNQGLEYTGHEFIQ